MNQEFNYDSFKDMSCSNFFEYLLTLSSNELSLLAIGLGFLFSNNLTINQQNSLGNFFELMGQVLLTISAQSMELVPDHPTRFELQQQINNLKQEIEQLKRIIP